MITVITGRRDTHQVLDAGDGAAHASFAALMERLGALRPR